MRSHFSLPYRLHSKIEGTANTYRLVSVERQENTGQSPTHSMRSYRPDERRILADVWQRLFTHGLLDESCIDVDIDGGEVILDGRVKSRVDKRTAEDLAESVRGVSDVHNRLRISP